jgi:hypothetical protein
MENTAMKTSGLKLAFATTLTFSSFFVFGGASSHAAVIGSDFSGNYSLLDLGTPGGVPGLLGGLTFLDNDTLLIGGDANESNGAIYQIDVTRDGTGTISGFSGSASFFANAPFIDGGLDFGPGGVLFFTEFPNNKLGQIKPGSNSPDKIIDLDPFGITSSVGTLKFVPSSFAGDGNLKIASYNGSTFYDVEITPDGMDTFDITGATLEASGIGGPEGLVYVDENNSNFSVDSLLISEFDSDQVGAYEIDGNGAPIVSSRRLFIDELSGAEGGVRDPVTGDFLFSTFGGGNRVVRVEGFVAQQPPGHDIPIPATFILFGFGLVALGTSRKLWSRNTDA